MPFEQWRSTFSQAVLVRVERITAWTRTAAGIAYRTVPSPLGPRPGVLPRAWLGAGHAVHALAEQVGVAVVPGVLLDHVGQDPAEREPLATPQPLVSSDGAATRARAWSHSVRQAPNASATSALPASRNETSQSRPGAKMPPRT